jgi:hypothetical protein
VLLLPAGNIEPDPVSRDAIASLESWSPSIGLMVRRVPHLYVVPAAVSGVLLSSYQRHPMTWIRRSAADRRQLAATLQVLARASSATVRLAYGPPLSRARRSLPHDATREPRRRWWSSTLEC